MVLCNCIYNVTHHIDSIILNQKKYYFKIFACADLFIIAISLFTKLNLVVLPCTFEVAKSVNFTQNFVTLKSCFRAKKKC